MRAYRYSVVDVFTEIAFAGNPLAVFLDAAGLSAREMQMLARELNLSETVFVFAPDGAAALARVRIFTPAAELAFAGHPTLGCAFALVTARRVPDDASGFVLAENIGPVTLRLERRAAPFIGWLRTPPIHFGATCDRGACAKALGLEPHDLLGDVPAQIAGAGNPFLYVALRYAEAVDRATLDVRALRATLPAETAPLGVFLFCPAPQGVYARMLAPELGVVEDPATGSATGPLGAYLAKYGLIPLRDGQRFTNEQGVKMQRRSLVHGILHVRDGALETVEVGGSAVHVIDATVTLP